MICKDRRHHALLGLLLCLHPAPTFAQSETGAVGDFATLRQSVSNGNTVVFVSSFAKCKTPSGTPGPNVSGLLTFGNFYIAERLIEASETILFETPDGRMLLKYIRLQIYPDNRAELTLRKLVPTTYEAAAAVIKYQCRLDDGSLIAHARP